MVDGQIGLVLGLHFGVGVGRRGFDDGGKDFATGRRWVWSTEDSSRQHQRRENCKKGAGGKMAETTGLAFSAAGIWSLSG